MDVWIESLPTAGAGFVIVGGFLLVTIVVGYLVDRFAPREVRIAHNDLGGFILAVIGVIYAVLLAFVTIGVWERYVQAESRSFDEATNLAVVYRDADVFPQSRELRETIRAYTEAVIVDEWPRMRHGGQSKEADVLIERVDKIVRTLPVDGPRRQDVHEQMLQAINEAQSDRDTRLSEDATGIDSLLWVVLIVGAVLTVGFTFLFGFRHSLMQQLMTGSLGLLIALVLYLTVAMNYPYRGGISVRPEAFHAAIATYDAIGP
jgi:heme/copper-type cytochrome/quinol oxidase subunit 2